MRVSLIAIIAAVALSFGCTKKAAPAPDAAAAPESAQKSTAAAPVDNQIMASALEDLNRKLQQQQYDAAVGSLVSMAQMPKTDAQEAQYRARLRETETALTTRAQKGDAAARQSVEMLGRMMTGR